MVTHPAKLEGLHAKYVALRRLRTAEPEGGEPVGVDPRPRMRALAARWPGALRELDELTVEAIDLRIGELRARLHDGLPAPRWVGILADYHGWMRVSLALKRAFRRDSEAARAWVRETYSPGLDEPPASALEEAVTEILRPPSGRLSRAVFERVAASHALDVAECEAEAFPPSPMRGALAARD